MPDVKIDGERVWVKASIAVALTVLSCGLAGLYWELKYAIRDLQGTQSQTTKSVDRVTEELQKGFNNGVQIRQFEQFLEWARLANREKYPGLIWPDLPR